MQVNFGLLGDIEAPKPLNLGTDILSGLQLAQEQKRQQAELALKQHKDLLDTQKTASEIALQGAQTAKTTTEANYLPIMNNAKLAEMQTNMMKSRVDMKKTLGEISMQPTEMATKQMEFIQKRNELVGNVAWAASQDKSPSFASNWENIYAPQLLRAGVNVPRKYDPSVKNTVNSLALQSKQYSELTKTALNSKLGDGFTTTDPVTGKPLVNSAAQSSGASQVLNNEEAKNWVKFKNAQGTVAQANEDVIAQSNSLINYVKKNSTLQGKIAGQVAFASSDAADEANKRFTALALARLASVPGASRGTKATLNALMATKPDKLTKPGAAINLLTSIKAAAEEQSDFYNNFIPRMEALGVYKQSKAQAVFDEIAAKNPIMDKNGKIIPQNVGAWKAYDLNKVMKSIDSGQGVPGLDHDSAVIKRNGIAQTYSRESYINEFIRQNPGKTRADAIHYWLTETGGY